MLFEARIIPDKEYDNSDCTVPLFPHKHLMVFIIIKKGFYSFRCIFWIFNSWPFVYFRCRWSFLRRQLKCSKEVSFRTASGENAPIISHSKMCRIFIHTRVVPKVDRSDSRRFFLYSIQDFSSFRNFQNDLLALYILRLGHSVGDKSSGEWTLLRLLPGNALPVQQKIPRINGDFFLTCRTGRPKMVILPEPNDSIKNL